MLGQRGLRLCQVAGRASVYPLSGIVVSLFVLHEGLVAVGFKLLMSLSFSLCQNDIDKSLNVIERNTISLFIVASRVTNGIRVKPSTFQV